MGMAFRGNIWCFKDKTDEEQADNVESSPAVASYTAYEQEMLCVVTTLLDHHQTWMTACSAQYWLCTSQFGYC